MSRAPPVLTASCVDVEALAPRLDEFLTYLNAAELARAGGFHTPALRDACILRRGWLRGVLAEQLQCRPADIEFRENAYGKPFMAGSELSFNLSHSRGKILMVCGPSPDIGCDIEWRDPALEIAPLVAQFFSAAERAAFAALLPEARSAGFFNGWTRKEAFVKAVGCGLSMPLSAFDVELDPARPARLLRGCDGWSLASCAPFPDYQAAIVAPGRWRLQWAIPAPASAAETV